MKTNTATIVDRAIHNHRSAAVPASLMAAVTAMLIGPAQALSFAPPQIYRPPTGAWPFAMTAEDFDRDGVMDLASVETGYWTSGAQGSVTCYRGNGDGTFSVAGSQPAGPNGWAIKSADLDGDDKIDLVVANRSVDYNPGSVSWFQGNGDGTFQAARRLPAGRQPYAIALADIEGDGDMDIIVANHGDFGSGGNIEILFGDGAGNFTENQPRIPQTGGLSDVQVADVNGDGILDLVAANWWGNTVSVLLGLGSGTFGPAVDFGVGQRCGSVALADFNEDGKPDIIAANTIDYDVSLLLGNGNGTFQAQRRYYIGGYVPELAVADMDKDGHADVILSFRSDSSPNAAAVLLGNGDGMFQPLQRFAMGTFSNGLEVADLNGDSYPDIAMAHYSGSPADDKITVMLQIPPNLPPVCDAGTNLQIAGKDQATTVIQGTGSDPDADALQYRWREGTGILRDWSSVGPGGRADLPLAGLPGFAIGSHTLTLEVSDSIVTVADDMILTVGNSLPEVSPAPQHQIVEIGVDPIVLTANAADYDGDPLSYEWFCETGVLDFGTVETPAGGGVVTIPGVALLPGDSRFGLGMHQVELRVSDGTNPPVSAFVSVEVTDTTQPSLSPLPDVTILWPPDHQLKPVVIQANAADNGGGPIHLTVQVTSSEPADAAGDGKTIPDYSVDSMNDTTGVIALRLRSERSGKGPGRTYSVTITAEDLSGNRSMASVVINAPHDKRMR